MTTKEGINENTASAIIGLTLLAGAPIARATSSPTGIKPRS